MFHAVASQEKADPSTSNGASPALPTSSINAEISLHLLPVLPGAIEVVDGGIVSTLQGQNERDNASAVEMVASDNGGDDERGARFRLMFDPQVRNGGGRVSSLFLRWSRWRLKLPHRDDAADEAPGRLLALCGLVRKWREDTYSVDRGGNQQS